MITRAVRLIFTGILFCCVLLIASNSSARPQTPPAERAKWHANWITHPTAPLREPEVVHFRKTFRLDAKPATFPVLVSADNRFLLFVNGQRVGEGPARGDFAHWRYERFDLAPFLLSGDNLIAATVWQFGIYAPLAQISDRLAFLVEGETDAQSAINTDNTWQVEEEKGHGIKPPLTPGMWDYYVGGPGERVDFSLYDRSWNQSAATSGNWVPAGPAFRESKYPTSNIPSVPATGDVPQRWLLYPDPLPPMEYKEVASPRLARTTGSVSPSASGALAVIPPNSKTNLLFDQGIVVSAYPEVALSGGKGARVQVVYAEALYDKDQKRGNRAEVGDRRALGVTDEIIADGGAARVFSPLWWRTYRFVELQVQTAAEPLELRSVKAFSTGYPFEDRGAFTSSDPELARIREICWRTTRLDAHETYMDAYWEQLQYFGDTRIEMLISYIVSGDDRLARQALLAANDSLLPEGLTQSRYPSSLVQIIPHFSLVYVNALHDYWMYRPDANFVAELLPGTRSVLAWFKRHERPDGVLGRMPYWNFVDWMPDGGNFPPSDPEGRSSVLTLQYIGALRDAAEMEEKLGGRAIAARYRGEAQVASESVYRLCWSEARGLLADTPEQNHFSEHANALAALYDVIPAEKQHTVLRRLLDARANPQATPKLAPASYYFQFYVSRALEHAGLGDLYVETLRPWREMLAKGFTTTPETPEPTRSDTHAWSAHPAYDFNTIIAGVRPDAPGFAVVRIAPSLGPLTSVEAVTPHPSGSIRTTFKRVGDKVAATIDLPPGLSGTLVWKSKTFLLHPGTQRLVLD